MNTNGTACAVGKIVSGDKSYDISLVLAEHTGKIMPVYDAKINSYVNKQLISDNFSFRLSDLPDGPIELGRELSFQKPFYIEAKK
jgi:hypothetical protein